MQEISYRVQQCTPLRSLELYSLEMPSVWLQESFCWGELSIVGMAGPDGCQAVLSQAVSCPWGASFLACQWVSRVLTCWLQGYSGPRATVSLLVGVAGPGFLVSEARSWGDQGSGGSYSSWPLVGGAPSLLCLPDSLWFLLYIFSCRRSFLLVSGILLFLFSWRLFSQIVAL